MEWVALLVLGFDESDPGSDGRECTDQVRGSAFEQLHACIRDCRDDDQYS
jgi:hypothetical protein